MLMDLAIVQFFVLLIFTILEKFFPNQIFDRQKHYDHLWVLVCLFGAVWLRCVMLYYPSPQNEIDNPVAAGVIFFFLYSFGGYWLHRFKHSNRFLWKYIHRFHHSPKHMESRVSMYRHPLEMFVNSAYILPLGYLFGASFEVICVALTIEGCLEAFHHSNIRLNKRFKWLGYFIQTPSMHLVHHEVDVHRHNYSTIFWDSIFGTAKIPDNDEIGVGFKGNDAKAYFFLKKN
ncbi:sterol desaturase family protein [Marinibactrum halimedae]|uniref:Fatty acid hydroxylase domain-containing protein n=1 Tax=Marinibactrum halimedae TaxID=1444977 RepID=A0AA37T4J8_9GAMM|nr:sterol desaturase family protein [Marinibactrum halimedae]MCD9459584.1 sterol desaturase family protein [Marinibactrum halimedae]GLS25599.1 hypothetical protein GCM10007877_13130 [Marinibactrum halimedae]